MVRSDLLRALVAGIAVFAAGCSVTISEDAKFSCAIDADCGGDGFVCTSGVCCKPSAETCNGVDDDCDGEVDEDIAARSCYAGPEGTAEVGACKSGEQLCVSGAWAEACVGQALPGTELCNALDDDCDGAVDNGFDLATDAENCGSCGNACGGGQCVNGVCAASSEVSCTDGADNDGDTLIDCADPECDAQACGTGCVCTGGAKTETDCGNAADDDGDQATDCADSDCAGKACGNGGTCTNDVCVSTVEVSCEDGQDNDGDTLIDCADSDCDTQSCGTGCVCANGAKTEALCSDGQDNDGDSSADCLDSDCGGALCQASPSAFTCDAQLLCSCNGNQTPGPELVCDDAVDDDCDGQLNCADADCNAQSCGAGCVCANSTKKEATCTDLLDNDGDGQVDCADVTDCPLNTACMKANGQPGSCNNQRQCK